MICPPSGVYLASRGRQPARTRERLPTFESPRQPDPAAYPRLFLRYLYMVLAVAFCGGGCNTVDTIRPPGQPSDGPGGADYRHATASSAVYGQGADEYWIFTPSDPTPDEAPVIVFLHGWGGMHPRIYGAWIQHLVRKGNIVVFPRYQELLRDAPEAMRLHALRAAQSAWNRLKTDGPVRPVVGQIGWIGHSFGGMLAARLAATSTSNGLPPPAFVFLVEPGAGQVVGLDELALIPEGSLVLVVVGEDDDLVGDSVAMAILDAFRQVPTTRLELVRMPSDRAVTPPILADHFAPLSIAQGFPPPLQGGSSTSPLTGIGLPGGTLRERVRLRRMERFGPPNVLDYFGFWKIADGLIDGAFHGEDLSYAFGDTVQQHFMGIHSDGSPVAPLAVDSAWLGSPTPKH